MPGFFRALATFWRAFFVSTSLCASSFAAPASTPAPLRQIGAPDPAEGRAALEQLRRQGIAGNYFLEFQLHLLPRRGDERVIPGKMWGAQNPQGPVSRVELGSGADAVRLLIQNGPESAAWRSRANGEIEQLGVGALFEPITPGADLTAFDLQMPFIYWNDFTYDGLTRFRGRPAHVLVLRPPAGFAANHPALAGVRVHLDTQFNALVQAELIGANGAILKTLSVVDLKKIGEQWIVKTIDLRDETTRDKTRLAVTAAALGVEFSRTLFEPAQLADEIRPPADAQLVRIEP